MKKKGGKRCLILAIVLLSGFFCFQNASANDLGLVISEIAWMGSVESANDEWMELYNGSQEDIDLDGYMIKAQDGSPEINLSGTIGAGKYFLLERTDDGSVPDIQADMIYSGSFGNSGEYLEMQNNEGSVIITIDAREAWPAGDNESKETMQLVNGEWISGEGTPKAENYELRITNDEAENGDESGDSETSGFDEPDKKEEKKEAKIIINEIYPNPPGSDREREFIELMNIGEASVDLTGWQINVDGKKYEFGKLDPLFEQYFSKTIDPGRHLVVFRAQSSLILKNGGSDIKIFKPGKKTPEDIVRYPEAPEGYSYVNTAYIDLDGISTSTREFFINSSNVGSWIFSSQISPGANNQVKALNTAPKAIFSVPETVLAKKEIRLDPSDTYDEEGDDLEYEWDFGDGVKVNITEASHTFFNPGEYEVVLKVSDNATQSFFKKTIHVLGENGIPMEKEKDDQDPIFFDWYEEDAPEFFYQPKINDPDLKTDKILSIKEARSAKISSRVKTSGIVTAVPGELGTQIFYVGEKGAGIKIYNYKKDFPDLEKGDLVEISGEIYVLRDEIALKIEGISSVTVLDKNKEEDEVITLVEEVSEELSGALVRTEGKIERMDGQRMYIKNGDEEILIYTRDGKPEGLERGKKIKAVGIVGLVSSDLAVQTRTKEDIEAYEEVSSSKNGMILGQSETKEWQLPVRDRRNEMLGYFLVISIAAIAVMIFFVIKKRRAV